MSTELLQKPGTVHELRHDLESHFFVLLYSALHFVKHIRPSGLDMEFIFDHKFTSSITGAHIGGAGKGVMYNKFKCDFESEPLTGLIRALFKLFRSLNQYNISKNWEEEPSPLVVRDVEKLKDCVEIKRLYAEALGSNGWLTVCDKVEDRYTPTRCSPSQRTEPVALSFFGCDPAAEPSTGKRKREDDVPPRPQQHHKEKGAKGRKRQ